MNNIAKKYIGVDVSKDTLDVTIYPLNEYFRVTNDEVGIDKIISRLRKHNVARIACESSGGYERKMVQRLREARYRVELLNPILVKHFILSKKIKAKTDKIDSYMIAMFTAHNEPTYVQPVLSEKHEEMRDMIRLRINTIEDISREKKRLKQCRHQTSKNFITERIHYLEKQIESMDIEVKQLVSINELWKRQLKILTSIPGIGMISAVTLLSEMPELGLIENKKIASLLGVAPQTKQSGLYVGTSIITGGRFIPRRLVYMAALSASHGKSKFKEFYQRLRSKGKKAKVCIVALMNKIIATANALLRKDEMWNPSFIV